MNNENNSNNKINPEILEAITEIFDTIYKVKGIKFTYYTMILTLVKKLALEYSMALQSSKSYVPKDFQEFDYYSQENIITSLESFHTMMHEYAGDDLTEQEKVEALEQAKTILKKVYKQL